MYRPARPELDVDVNRPMAVDLGRVTPPIEGGDEDQQAPNSSRRPRALGLIALAVTLIGAAGFAFLSPTWTAKPKPILFVEAPALASGPVPIPPLSQTFASPMMGYSVKYPAGWKVTPATEVWRGEWWTWRGSDVDQLDGQFVGLHATSQALAPGESAGGWMDKYLVSASSHLCGDLERVAIAGEIGVIDLNGCDSFDVPGRIYDLAVVAGGRGYSFTIEGAVDHAFFLAMLATVTFSGPTH